MGRSPETLWDSLGPPSPKGGKKLVDHHDWRAVRERLVTRGVADEAATYGKSAQGEYWNGGETTNPQESPGGQEVPGEPRTSQESPGSPIKAHLRSPELPRERGSYRGET